jgi:hypothetical protein
MHWHIYLNDDGQHMGLVVYTKEERDLATKMLKAYLSHPPIEVTVERCRDKGCKANA